MDNSGDAGEIYETGMGNIAQYMERKRRRLVVHEGNGDRTANEMTKDIIKL